MITERKKRNTLKKLERRLEPYMIGLSVLWLALFVYEFAYGLNQTLEIIGSAIWIIFIAEFTIRLWIAPEKTRFLRKNWLTGISLILPALRVLRVVRAFRLLRLARTARGLRLVRLAGTLNRGSGILNRSLGRRGFGYVVILTFLVVILGSAAMFGFEKGAPGQEGFQSYGEALWWTAMLSTTVGSEYWPTTVEGRLLTYLISLYAISIIGYVAGSLASAFVDLDQKRSPDSEVRSLKLEIIALREELAQTTRVQEHPN